MAGSGKSTFSRRARGQDRLASHPSRPPLLEARLGRAVGGPSGARRNGACSPATRDRRRQLPRDTRSPSRTRGHPCGPRHALVAVLRTRVPARVPDAGRAARRVRLLGLAPVARRVAAGLRSGGSAAQNRSANARPLRSTGSMRPFTCSGPAGVGVPRRPGRRAHGSRLRQNGHRALMVRIAASLLEAVDEG